MVTAMTDLLKRAEFFQQLQDILADAMHGHGRVGLVTGEAGIGKTSLVEQFLFTPPQIKKNQTEKER
jgi:predicted ATPase